MCFSTLAHTLNKVYCSKYFAMSFHIHTQGVLQFWVQCLTKGHGTLTVLVVGKLLGDTKVLTR